MKMFESNISSTTKSLGKRGGYTDPNILSASDTLTSAFAWHFRSNTDRHFRCNFGIWSGESSQSNARRREPCGPRRPTNLPSQTKGPICRCNLAELK